MSEEPQIIQEQLPSTTEDEIVDESNNNNNAVNEDDDEAETEDLPPLRIHATRVPAKLSAQNLKKVSGHHVHHHHNYHTSSSGGPGSDAGSDSASSHSNSQHNRPGRGHVRRQSGSKQGGGGSRSRSHSPRQHATGTTTMATESTFELTSNSSISSIQELQENLNDPDILLDKTGFEDLDPMMGERSKSELLTTPTLTAVNERLSDDTLEDVRAFSDINPPSTTRSNKAGGTKSSSVPASREGSICATLDEIEEEDDDDVVDDDDNKTGTCEVILENMENLNIEDDKAKQQNTTDVSVPSDW